MGWRGWLCLCLLLNASQFSQALGAKKGSRDSLPAQCQDLSKQIDEMQNAQAQLLKVLVRKNQAFSKTVSDFADSLGGVGKKITTEDLESLRAVSTAFQKHQVREQKIVDQFVEKTDFLMGQVKSCSLKPISFKQSQELDLR
jgi:hypothetical protein